MMEDRMSMRRLPRTVLLLSAAAVLAALAALVPRTAPALPQSGAPAPDPRLAGASRSETNGWIVVRLAGDPATIGYQHGRLLQAEIQDALAVEKLSFTHDGKRDWAFYRRTAEMIFWPKVDPEYQQELRGIAEGAGLDLWDVVALNANLEFSYYTDQLDAKA